jgi:predicted MFS family arabinose efflux permease
LSRTLSGFIGDTLGWRAMFWIASGLCLVLFLSSRNNFLIISQSLMARTIDWFAFHLNQSNLREATLINVFSFNLVLWTTMVLLLSEEPFNY